MTNFVLCNGVSAPSELYLPFASIGITSDVAATETSARSEFFNCFIEPNSLDSSETFFEGNSDPVLAQLKALAMDCAVDDWDGDGAKAIDIKLIPKLYEVLKKEPFSRLPSPELQAENDGEINIGWYGRSGESFTFSLNSDERIAYALYTPNGMKLCGTGKLTDDLSIFQKFIQEVTA